MGRLFRADEFMPIAMEYGSHPITQDLKAATLFPYARSVEEVESTKPGVTTTDLVKTGQRSWAESKPNISPIKYNEDEDTRGPITIAIASEADVPDSLRPAASGDGKKEPKTRLVVVGDSDFAANAYLDFSGNSDLFLNMVGWLAQMEDLISIRPKNPEDRRVNLTMSQVGMVRLITLLLMPLLTVIAGFLVWWQRRNKS